MCVLYAHEKRACGSRLASGPATHPIHSTIWSVESGVQWNGLLWLADWSHLAHHFNAKLISYSPSYRLLTSPPRWVD